MGHRGIDVKQMRNVMQGGYSIKGCRTPVSTAVRDGGGYSLGGSCVAHLVSSSTSVV